ncbi:hypothetical protein [Nocardia jinanensis]|uniref:Uncharacterized protein n=1 Tax=Nocardia jinanensis TaxID=382504 RepID=A0A917RV13_9NOCA|nr:hypothetical protein [Nocardia jinanensis]GGL30807.1 hypothetical protein GCM10011588_51920 [Nocardia jinanensis]
MAEQLIPARWTQRVLDRLIPVAAGRAAAPGGIRFTERQLYYELCRVLAPAPRLPRRVAFTVPAPLPFAAFRAALARYGEVPGLLAPEPPRRAPPGTHTPEPDLFDYGLPRLLVCESHTVAQMLRANGLPLESATPVVSIAELPLRPAVVAMLTRGAGSVYVLHETSAAGLALPNRLPELAEIPDGLRVVPLGLRPRQAMGLHLFHTAPTVPGQPELLSGMLSASDPAAPDGTTSPAAPASAVREQPERTAGPALGDRGPAHPHRYPPESEPYSRPGFLDDRERTWLRRGRIVELDAVAPAVLLRSAHRLVRGVRTPPPPLAELRRARGSGFLTWPAA